MQTIGRSTIEVPKLSLGCMSLGTNKRNANKIISKALDEGILHLDTADLYDFGQNEAIIGQLIKHHRDQIVITTKVGNHFNPVTKDWYWDPSKAYILKAIEKSLSRLQTDYIDLYLLHGGTIDDPIADSIEAFELLKKSGTIRTYGISSIRPNVIKEYLKHSNIDAVMMQYSMLDRRPEELLDALYEKQISVLARGPLAKGILTNQFGEYVRKKANKGYLAYNYEELEAILHNLSTLGLPLQQLAFQYVLKHPAVVSAIFGASNEDQLQLNSQYLHTGLMDDVLYENIQRMTKSATYVHHRSNRFENRW